MFLGGVLLVAACSQLASTPDSPGVDGAREAGEQEQEMAQILQSLFQAETGDHHAAATTFAQLGQTRQDPELMRLAVSSALHAKDLRSAVSYAEQWENYGGGGRAGVVVAELYVLTEQYQKAILQYRPLLAAQQIKPSEAAKALRRIRDIDRRLAIAADIFDATDDAQHAAHLRMVTAAGKLVDAQALLHDFANANSPTAVFWQADLHQKTERSRTPLPVLSAYVGAECGGEAIHCTLPAVLAAYAAFAKGKEDWLQPLQAEDAHTQDWLLAGGRLLVQWKHYEQAIALFQQAEGFAARHAWAMVAEHTEGLEAALAVLQDATVQTQDELVTRARAVASYQRQLQRLPQALETLTQALQQAPNNFRLLYDQAFILEEIEDAPAAIAVLVRITELYPDNSDGWNALGYTMADHNIDLAQAQMYIERALREHPDSPAYIDSLGWVLYRQGRHQQALVHLRQAAETARSAEVGAHLGEVLWETGNYAEARKVWRDAQTIDGEDKVLQETLARYQPF